MIECKITEKQARDMLALRQPSARNNGFIDAYIEEWKQAGYIKKTKLEEAEDYVDTIERIPLHVLKMIKIKYRVAIKEIQDNKYPFDNYLEEAND